MSDASEPVVLGPGGQGPASQHDPQPAPGGCLPLLAEAEMAKRILVYSGAAVVAVYGAGTALTARQATAPTFEMATARIWRQIRRRECAALAYVDGVRQVLAE